MYKTPHPTLSSGGGSFVEKDQSHPQLRRKYTFVENDHPTLSSGGATAWFGKDCCTTATENLRLKYRPFIRHFFLLKYLIYLRPGVSMERLSKNNSRGRALSNYRSHLPRSCVSRHRYSPEFFAYFPETVKIKMNP